MPEGAIQFLVGMLGPQGHERHRHLDPAGRPVHPILSGTGETSTLGSCAAAMLPTIAHASDTD